MSLTWSEGNYLPNTVRNTVKQKPIGDAGNTAKKEPVRESKCNHDNAFNHEKGPWGTKYHTFYIRRIRQRPRSQKIQ
eukprot:scaffold40890_cov62-Attheya_sp.AAC.9